MICAEQTHYLLVPATMVKAGEARGKVDMVHLLRTGFQLEWAWTHQTYMLFLTVQLQALRVKWSHLRLPWVDLDWLLDISCQITELDLSANCLPSLPSIIPWGLINLKKLNLSNNHLGELPCVQSSDEIICSRWAQECGQGPLCPPVRVTFPYGVLG